MPVGPGHRPLLLATLAAIGSTGCRAPLPGDSAPTSRPGGLLVRVIDAAGNPRAGVPVDLGHEPGGAWHGDHFAGVTGSSGELTIDDRALDEQRTAWRERGRQVEVLFVTVPCIGLPSPTQRIAFDRAAGNLVTLSVPPSGTVTARLRDAEGRIVDQRLDVNLDLLESDGVTIQQQCDSWVNWLLHPLRDARLGPLALGRTVRVKCETLAGIVLQEKTLPGPARDGEDVLVEWQLPAPCSSVSGRIVLPDGRAVPNATFLFRLTGPHEDDARVNLRDRFRTDAEGRFRIALPDVSGKTVAQLWCDEIDERGETPRRAVATATPFRMRPGDNDAGTLQLTEVPLVVSFRAHAPDRLEVWEPLVEILPRDWPDGAPWNQDPVDELKWCRSRSGRVEFRAWTRVETFDVRAFARDYEASEWRTVRRGATGLEFTLGPRRERK